MTSDFEPVILEFAVDHTECMHDRAVLSDKLDEVRGLLSELIDAVNNPGSSLENHKYIMKKHRQEWPLLWKTIDKIKKRVR